MEQLGRREFLAASLAAGTGIVVAANAQTPRRAFVSNPSLARALRATQPMTMKYSLKYGMIGPGTSVLEKFRVVRDCGFDGVELDSPGMPPAEEVRRAMAETGIVVPGVVNSTHWQTPFSHPDEGARAKMRDSLITSIKDCAAVGGTTVLLVPAVVSKEVSYADAWDRSRDEIARLLPVARDHNIRIAIENVWNNFLLSPLEAARYIDSFEDDAIGWYFDVGNIVNYGWPEHWVRTLAHRILKLDVKEFSRKKRNDEGLWKGFGVEIGEGDCDWPAVMASLRDVNYSGGWASAEVGGGDETRLRDVADRMKRLVV